MDWELARLSWDGDMMSLRACAVSMVACLALAFACLGESTRPVEKAPSSAAGVGVPEANPVVRDVEDQHADGWSEVQTANFRVFYRQDRELAAQAARVAEQTRLAVLRKWLGEDREEWTARCELYLHETAQAYSRRTGVPACSPGHSSISWTESGSIRRRIDLHCDNPSLLTAILPHECTHAALAGKFGQRRIPPWADEGMAVLTEPDAKVERHLRNLARFHEDNKLFPICDLMAWGNYPSTPDQITAFYAECVSLVRFLSSVRGPQVFTRFVRESMDAGCEHALVRNYGWDIAELELRWQRHEFGEGKAE